MAFQPTLISFTVVLLSTCVSDPKTCCVPRSGGRAFVLGLSVELPLPGSSCFHLLQRTATRVCGVNCASTRAPVFVSVWSSLRSRLNFGYGVVQTAVLGSLSYS